MRKISPRANLKYLITIGILLSIIIVQWAMILSKSNKKTEIRKQYKENIVKINRGKIAIVIDDWGYNLRNLDIVEQIDYPLTLSILPNLAYSRRVAEEFNRLGLEVMLHLPMEPHEDFGLEENTIMADASSSDIKETINIDLSNILYAKGVSNHMGSKVTEDKRPMGVIFHEIKDRGLYYLDSFVSADSVCADLAKEIGIKFLKRDIFLDNNSDPQYIRGQMDKLKSQAKAKGYAVGIGHNRKTTLEVIKEELPRIEKEGYRLVFLSGLLGE